MATERVREPGALGSYNSTAPTLSEAEEAALQLDVNANLKTTNATLAGGEDLTNNVQGVTHKPIAASTYSPTLKSAITEVTKANVKASAGNVLAIYCSNVNAAVRFFQLHNKATAPAATEVPIYSFPIPIGAGHTVPPLVLGSEFWTVAGAHFTTGIGWAISTVFENFTDSATDSEHKVFVHYI